MNKKVVFWGRSGGYEGILNQILFEIEKGNISVEALVCEKEDIYCSQIDSFPIISKEELADVNFDYLIIHPGDDFAKIKKKVMGLGIPERAIINASVFTLPLFDFGRYGQLLENPVTILSDDCWGGAVYNRLKLPFSSPLINILWDKDEYSKFIQDPMFYLGTELKLFSEGNLKAGIAPIGQLGEEGRTVRLRLVHNTSFAEAKEQWDRRVKRVNAENVFVKMGFGCYEENCEKWLHIFSGVPYKKILFYSGESVSDAIFFTERFEWYQKNEPYVRTYSYVDYMLFNYFVSIDVLKLLVDGKDYSRDL